MLDTSYSFVFPKKIDNFAICCTDFAYNLVCLAEQNKLSLGVLQFPEDSKEVEQLEWLHIKDIYLDSRCFAVCFSPKTSIVCIPKMVQFCIAGSDFILRIYRTDLQDSVTLQKLKGHTNYVNDVAWDYDGEYLASVSDDLSCKIWSSGLNFENVTTFCLSSAGMSIKWHPDEPNRLLVAEKKGIIHIYNVRSQHVILSIESNKAPLTSSDWALSNRFMVSALCLGDIVTWDLRRPCIRADTKQMHLDAGRLLKYCPYSETTIASIGRPDVTLKVTTMKSTVPIIEASLKIYGGLSWHHRFPYVCAVSDRKLCFWKVNIK